MLSRKALAAMLEAHLRAHPLAHAAPLPQPRLPTRTGIPRNVRCLAAKAPEEKSWLELAGTRPEAMRILAIFICFIDYCCKLHVCCPPWAVTAGLLLNWLQNGHCRATCMMTVHILAALISSRNGERD